MGAPLRSVSSLTIWGPPQVSFFAYYKGAPSDQFFRLLCGAPLDKFLRILYGGPLRSVSSLTIGGPLRSVSSHTIWGPPQISFFAYYIWGPPQTCFFAYYMGPPSDQFLRLLNRGPFGQFLHLLYGATLIFFLKFYALNYSWGAPIFFNFQGGASAPSCPPLRAPMRASCLK